ncbi:D-alanyl-D-alanine carboxypeptidase/D-alanyl-D-alanine endopeptidase [Lentisalinibacter orientalis]|uniref:D-alanyl-D-alanine carboxypeptidase/D-alanyl-D-alanine endopeptidase n=1 Tax=Lentisalinibacter orientalis TaxID=2992241 RepID=UPI0038694CB2
MLIVLRAAGPVAVLVAFLAATPAAAALPPQVQAVLDGHGLDPDDLSIHVQELGSGREVLAHNADAPRNPASVLKLLTTFAALDELGPAHTWQTDVYLDGRLEDGVLDGDLILRGGGDPYLVQERFWLLLRELRRRGLQRIEGDLILDTGYFQPAPEDRGAFDNQPLRAYNVTPHALLVNFNVVRFWFEPAADGVLVDMEPPLANLRVDNRLQPAAGRCRGYQRGIAVRARRDERAVTFSGDFPAACGRYSLARSVLGHEDFVFGLFTALWRETGGELGGGLVVAETPPGAERLFTMTSLPLGEVIRSINKYSNNVMTRQLLFTLGAERYGPPGTEEKGRRAVAAWLDDRGFRFPELVLENGAGRSREARITARHMGELLTAAWASPWMPEFAASMAISGMDGTYGRRRGGTIAGRARLKTGSLDHVSTLAGYLQAGDGTRYAVVVLHNAGEVHRGPGDELQDALLEWLNQFSLSPEAP